MLIIKEVGLKRVIKYVFFSLWQIIFDLLSFSPLRIAWMRLFGASIGPDTIIDKIDFINLERSGLKGLSIGTHCFLGRGVLLDLAGRITLEDWVIVSPKGSILTHLSVGLKAHPLYKKYPPKIGHTQIQRGSFIGAGAIILGGQTIGSRSMIGAGAVVTKRIPQESVAVGIPASVKKKI